MNGKAFLAISRNYSFMPKVGRFQPFKHSLYSAGALYMVLMHLPRSERSKLENVMLVGMIPGPHEHSSLPILVSNPCCCVKSVVEGWNHSEGPWSFD